MLHLFIFSIAWIVADYFFNCLLLKKFIVPDWRKAFVYMGGVALIGPIGEVAINTFYELVFGVKLWVYHVLPIHDGNTSLYSFFIWSLYGFHLYLLHTKLGEFGDLSEKRLSLVISIEAIILEIAMNISALFFLNTYIFYYFPNELWHLTSLQVIPFYFLGGLVITKTLKRFKRDPLFFGIMSFLISFVFCFLV